MTYFSIVFSTKLGITWSINYFSFGNIGHVDIDARPFIATNGYI
jgi:hypothetical protein